MNRQKHKLSRRILAVLLMAAMLITMLPSAMFAQDGQGSEPTTTVSTPTDSPIQITKSVEENEDGSYNLTMEAYASNMTSNVTKPLDIVLVLDVSGSMDEYMGGRQSKLTALKTAANNFIDQFDAQNKNIADAADKHHVAVVKFAGDKIQTSIGNNTYRKDGKAYNYTQTVKGFTSDANQLKAAVNSLDAAGSTAADSAFEHVEAVLDSADIYGARANATQVVVFFTDGEPNHFSGWDESVARNAVNSANSLKSDGVTIYSIGMFSGADPEDTNSSFNKYMNAISSKYPDAEYKFEENWWGGGSWKFNLGTPADGDYYFAANSSESLNNVFNNIATDIKESLAVNPDDYSVLSDTLSEFLDFPQTLTGNNPEEVTVKYAKVTGYENGQFVFGEPSDRWSDEKQPTVKVENNKIEITGFDYKNNAATYNSSTGDYSGGKLVVTFPILVDQNAVNADTSIKDGLYPTNNTSESKAGMTYKENDRWNSTWTSTELDESPEVYCAKQEYTVSYKVTGDEAPESYVGTVPETSNEYQGSKVNVAADLTTEETTKDGVPGTWTFNGWKTEDVKVEDGSFTMPGNNVEFTGSWTFTAKTYELNYHANGGEYLGDFAEEGIATVSGLKAGEYDIWTVGENGQETGKMPAGEFLPVHDPVIDADTEEEFPVVFVGWSETKDDTLYKKGDYLPDTVLYKPGTQVTIADADRTLYAVWGYDKNKNGTADVLEKLTLTYDINGGYGTEPVDRNPYMKGDQVTLETEALPVHSPADDGTAVVFLGWGLKQVDTIYAAGEDYSAAGVTESVTFEDEDITVYAVWGYDENNDGVADATQVLITPADITAYTGGTPYGGIADINGNIITETVSGLPEPGYFITLPYDVQQWLNAQTGTTVGATNLHDYMTFTYKGTDGSGGTTTREWKLEYQGVYETDENGNALRYVYSLAPATVDGKEIPVRLNYFKDTNNNGKLDETETALTNDDILMSKDLAHDTFSMTINPGELDQSVIKAAFNANGDTKDSAVGIGTGTLTVKSVTDVGTTTNAIGNSESDVTENTLTAVANSDVTYYVNDSLVDVENRTDRVKLLVDSVSNNDEFNAQMGQHAIEAVEGSSDTHDYELAYMDLVDTANGNTEVTLGKGTLTIYWPMPENADPDGDFQVVHYTDMNREGTVSDLNEVEKEKLAVTKVTVNGKDYLTFEVFSFSPFALVYTADDGSDTPDYPDYPIWTPDGDDDGPSGLNTEDHFSYVVSYAEDYRTGEATDNEDLWPVKPNNQITRAEVATIFYRLLEDEVRDEYDTTTNDFSDVTADSWYNQTVSTLARMGIVKGYEDGSFRPNAPITRAEFGAIATRFFAETGATYEPGTFTDVTGDEWFANAIQDAVNLGLIGGYEDGTVRPNNNITRAESCAIVNRTLGRVPDADHLLPADEMKTWPDDPESAWFYADMQEATNGHEYEWITEDGNKVEEWLSIMLDNDWTDR